MPTRDRVADGYGVAFGHAARRQARSQRRAIVVARHLDRVLDGVRVGLVRDRQAMWSTRDERDDAAVDARREAAVQPDLLRAGCAAPLQAAVVDEREADGLLDLVGAPVGEEDPGDV